MHTYTSVTMSDIIAMDNVNKYITNMVAGICLICIQYWYKMSLFRLLFQIIIFLSPYSFSLLLRCRFLLRFQKYPHFLDGQHIFLDVKMVRLSELNVRCHSCISNCKLNTLHINSHWSRYQKVCLKCFKNTDYQIMLVN